jgi:hypothetical protein
MEAAKKTHPKAYKALRELVDSSQFRIRSLENKKAANFYINVSFNYS